MDGIDKESNNLQNENNKMNQLNECPKKDKEGNCLVPGVYRDSDEIGGG